ncbi:MAG: hypothetical protein IJ555_04195, partial [Ruminococcus sp.]|nr:hypothetical protein [Ruminococcus sp.]
NGYVEQMEKSGYTKRAIDFVRTKSCCSDSLPRIGADCLIAACEQRLAGSAQTPENEGGTLIEGTKEEKGISPPWI